MSDGLNRVILLGNVGADPELRYTAAGLPVLSLRLATNESFVDRNKEIQQRTDWHSVVVWGARAEALARTLSKGVCLLVEGGLRTSSYEKEGQKRYKTEVHAREICFTSRRSTSVQPDEEPLMRSPLTSRDGVMSAPSPAELDPTEEDPQAPPPPPPRNARSGKSASPTTRPPVDELPF